MDFLTRIQKHKKRQFIILSASSIHCGLECLVLETESNQYQIIHHQTFHYSQQIKDLLSPVSQSENPSVSIKDLALLDNLFTGFISESTQQLIAQIPSKKRRFDCIILQNYRLFNGLLHNKKHPMYWNVSLGDPCYLAMGCKIPVLSDLYRKDILYHGTGYFSTAHGDLIIAKKSNDTSLFLNIGLTARLTVVDPVASKIILDSCTGPGTFLIDIAAQNAGYAHGFDRDGSGALTGNVNMVSLETLIADDWFKIPGTKEADLPYLRKLLQHPCLSSLSPTDTLATLTALTALSINQYFKREYTYEKKPGTIWISGGGAHNLTLLDFLKSYFAPIPVKSIEELNIAANSKSSLALGLTINAFLNKEITLLKNGAALGISEIGKWVYP